jgi:hypothetical protein
MVENELSVAAVALPASASHFTPTRAAGGDWRAFSRRSPFVLKQGQVVVAAPSCRGLHVARQWRLREAMRAPTRKHGGRDECCELWVKEIGVCFGPRIMRGSTTGFGNRDADCRRGCV